jgi:membrane protein
VDTALVRVRKRELFLKFQADRGTQLAAMIAYYALISFVPLTFLALSLLGLFGRANESSYLVDELTKIFPNSSVSTIVSAVRAIQENSAALGIVGLLFLLWSSLGLFGALESAFNIVYGRPNRPFLLGKALATFLMFALLILLFAGLVIGSFSLGQVERHAPGVAGNSAVALVISVLTSTVAVFIFLLAVYLLLTNAELTLGDVLPGTVVATVVMDASFQVLPVYLRLSHDSPVLQALGGPVILLVWMYLMANVIVFGAEVNWWRSRRRIARLEEVPGSPSQVRPLTRP